MGVTTWGIPPAQAENAPRISPELRGTLVDWLRGLRHAPDRILHGRRRRVAARWLRGTNPRSVLFVCHGNICRSPFAAASFEQSLPSTLSGTITTSSAGFIGPERSSPSTALSVGQRYGIDLSAHRSALLTSQKVQTSDLIVVMSRDQAKGIRARLARNSRNVLVLGDLDPLPIRRRSILDPWAGPDAAFEASYSRIDRCVRELARLVATGAPQNFSR